MGAVEATEPSNSILIIGDSLVAGEGADNWRGWAQRLAEIYPADIIGVCGATSGDLLEHLPAKPYGLVVVQVGTNDARFRHRKNATEVSIERYRRNLATIVAAFRARNSATQFIFVDLFYVDETRSVLFKPDRSYFARDLTDFSRALEEYALQTGLLRVALSEIRDGDVGLADGLHPSEESHRRIFHKVAKVLSVNRAA